MNKKVLLKSFNPPSQSIYHASMWGTRYFIKITRRYAKRYNVFGTRLIITSLDVKQNGNNVSYTWRARYLKGTYTSSVIYGGRETLYDTLYSTLNSSMTQTNTTSKTEDFYSWSRSSTDDQNNPSYTVSKTFGTGSNSYGQCDITRNSIAWNGVLTFTKNEYTTISVKLTTSYY